MRKIKRKYSLLQQTVMLIAKIWNHPANRGRKGSAFARALYWQVRKRLLPNKAMLVEIFDGIQFVCDPHSTFASNINYFGDYCEYNELHFVRRYLRPGDGFIDVGANVGIYSLLAAKIVGKDGAVIAFEPFPDNADRLNINVECNHFKNVTIHRMAIGNQEGEVNFLSDGDVSNRIVSKLTEGHSHIQVTCTTLDKIMPERNFAMAKLDVEGAELFALEGSAKHLADRNPPVWLFEASPGTLKRHNVTLDQCLEIFRGHGFELATYSANNNQMTYHPQEPPSNDNLWAIHRDYKDEVRYRLAQNKTDNG